jgi:general secretion pathway protein C
MLLAPFWIGLALAAPPKFPGVHRKSETRYVVDQAELDKQQAGFNEILQSARVVPNVENGAFNGFRFQQIDSASFLAALGFKKGDVVTQVNDVVLDNPGKGLMAFQQLKGEKEFTVWVSRGKRKIRVHYSIGTTADQRKRVGASASSAKPKR